MCLLSSSKCLKTIDWWRYVVPYYCYNFMFCSVLRFVCVYTKLYKYNLYEIEHQFTLSNIHMTFGYFFKKHTQCCNNVESLYQVSFSYLYFLIKGIIFTFRLQFSCPWALAKTFLTQSSHCPWLNIVCASRTVKMQIETHQYASGACLWFD